MQDRIEEERLREILDQTDFPSPAAFTWGSVGGFLIAFLLLIIGSNSSNAVFLLLAFLALLIGALSALEGRIWSVIARRNFIRRATRAGLTAEGARRFWDSLDELDASEDGGT